MCTCIAPSNAGERIVAPQPIDSQRFECVCPHTAAPVRLCTSSHSTILSRHIFDLHVFDPGAPDPNTIIARVLDVTVLQGGPLDSTMDVKPVGS